MTTDRARLEERLVAQIGWVTALAQRLVADPHVADDVLQRVCLLALQRPPRGAGDERSLRAWLAGVTRRVVRHVARAEVRRARRERLVARPERQSAEDAAARREHLRLLVAALTSLDDEDFSVLVTRYYEGLSYAEAAARAGVSTVALRKRVSRARARLRARLERDLGAEGRRWLLGLAPLTRVDGTSLPRAAVPAARHGTQPPSLNLGGLSMAKSLGALQVSLGILLVSGGAAGVWWGLRAGEESPAVRVGPAPPRVPASTGGPELPPPLPPVPRTPLEPLAGSVTPDDTGAAAPAPAADRDGAADLAALLDEAAASFLGDPPDLSAFDALLRRLALSASVIQDTVVRDPLDGSVGGWLAFEGTDLKAHFRIGAGHDYRVEVPSPEDGLPDGWTRRSLSWRFRDEGGTAAGAGATVQFHPDTSPDAFPELLRSLGAEGDRLAGWGLEIGPDGTRGRALRLRPTHDGGVSVGFLDGAPAWQQPWAHDASAYELWLRRLREHMP